VGLSVLTQPLIENARPLGFLFCVKNRLFVASVTITCVVSGNGPQPHLIG
jgi:hypothetical protein